MASPLIRLPDDLYDAARSIGPRHGRSTVQQITHWAQIGREYERLTDREQ